MREKLIALLAANGFVANAAHTEDQLMAELTKALAANSANKGEEVPAWAQALMTNMKTVSDKVDSMEKTKMTAEEEAKAKKAKELAANSAIAGLGFVEADLLKMETNRLDDLYAKHSGQIVGNAYAGMGARTEGVAEIDLNSLLQGAE